MAKPFEADFEMRLRFTEQNSEVFAVGGFTESITRKGWGNLNKGAGPEEISPIVNAIAKERRMTFVRHFDTSTPSLVDAKAKKSVLPELRLVIVVWYRYYDEHMKEHDRRNPNRPLPQRTLYWKKGLYLDRVTIVQIIPNMGARDVVTVTAEAAKATENFLYCQSPIGMWARMPCHMITPETIRDEINNQPSLGPDSRVPKPPPVPERPMPRGQMPPWFR